MNTYCEYCIRRPQLSGRDAFKAGDRVQVMTDDTMIGKVNYVHSCDVFELYPYTVEFDDPTICSASYAADELISLEETKVTPYKVGDRVLVNDGKAAHCLPVNGCSYRNQYGRIKEVHKYVDDQFSYDVLLNGKVSTIPFMHAHLDPIDAPAKNEPKFKEGDRVKLADNYWGDHNKGYVKDSQPSGDSYIYDVLLDTGFTYSFAQDGLELLDDDEKPFSDETTPESDSDESPTDRTYTVALDSQDRIWCCMGPQDDGGELWVEVAPDNFPFPMRYTTELDDLTTVAKPIA